jgi:tetratricopeptide (TPR) repeat protein
MNSLSRPRLSLLLALALCAFFGAGCTKSYKAKRLLAAGERDYQAQLYDAAEIDFESVRQLFPRNPTAIGRLGLIYFQQGRLPRAYAFLNLAHQLSPINSEVALRLAQVLVEANHFKDAGQLSTQVISQDPANEEAPLALADAARSPAELAAAYLQIQQAQLATPTNPGFSAALGMIDLRQNNPAAAKAEFEKALQMDPKLAPAHLGLAGVCASHKDVKGMAQELKLASDVSPPRSVSRLKYAEFKIQTGSLDAGKDMLQQILLQAPDYMPALLMLMKTQFSQHQYDECAATVAKILARDNSNFDALLESGNIYLSKRDGLNALEIFQHIDAEFHDKAIVQYDLGAAYLLQNDKAHALASLHAAIGLDRDYAPAVLLLAELDIRSGDSGEAIIVLNPLLEKQPNNPKAHLELAQAYLAQGRSEPALEVYARMLQQFPNNPQIPFLMGTIYEQTDDVPQAYKFFEQALALSPDNPSALEKLTELDLVQKHYAEAQQRVAGQMQKNPSSAEPWILQARIYWARGQTNDAQTAFSKAISLDPASPLAYLLLARLYLDSHQQQQALDRLTSLTSKTNDLTAWLEIAMIHQVANDYTAARDAYQKVLSVNPNSVPAINNLAYLYSEYLGDLPQAHLMADRARELQPYDPHGADTLGWILYKEGQYPRALSDLQDAAEKLPGDPEVLTHLGMTYYMMEEEDLARLYLQRATASRQDFAGKQMALQSLQLLAINPSSINESNADTVEKRLAAVPDDPIALSRLAAINELRAQPDKAADVYKKILARNTQDWNAMINLARLYAGPFHDDRKALDLAKSAHDIAPDEPRVDALLGDLVYRAGNYVWALSLLQGAADKLPNQPGILYDLAWASYSVGHLADADAAMSGAVRYGQSFPKLNDAKQFLALRSAADSPADAQKWSDQVQKILDQQPNYLPAAMVSALLHQSQGDDKAAAQIYLQALAQFPFFTPAMRALALIAVSHSEDDPQAYEWALKAQPNLPGDRPFQRALGILAYRHSDYSRSAELLSLGADDGEALYYLGMDYYYLRQLSDSKRTLTRALTLNVPSSFATDARRVLAELK